jgi:hypothetical protein
MRSLSGPDTFDAAALPSSTAEAEDLTVSRIAVDALALKLPLPAYDAAIVCMPAFSVDVLKVATPFGLIVAVRRTLCPSLKVTEPLGCPAPGARTVTVALKVTAMCKPTVVGVAVNMVLVLAFATD